MQTNDTCTVTLLYLSKRFRVHYDNADICTAMCKGKVGEQRLQSTVKLRVRSEHCDIPVSVSNLARTRAGSWNRIVKNGQISGQPELDVQYIRNFYVLQIFSNNILEHLLIECNL